MSRVSKRIAPGAYQALRDALPVVFWFKRPFEGFVRTALRDNPELLSSLNFGEPKRIVADHLVERMVSNESQYHEVTIQFMVEVGSMQRFPDLEKHENSKQLIADAEKAVAELRCWTERYQEVLAERDRLQAEARAIRDRQDALRKFGQDLDALKARFLEMQLADDAAGRGNDFQRFLRDIFALFDMEPRLLRRSLPAPRRSAGPKRAAMAVAHTMLIAVYNILRNGVHYEELGANQCQGKAPLAPAP